MLAYVFYFLDGVVRMNSESGTEHKVLISDLTKKFGYKHVLKGITLEVNHGEN